MSVIHITENNFEEQITEARVPVLVDFWASWCGPCQMMGPVVEQISEEMGVNAKVCKINIDEQSELAQKYNITSVPTFLLFKEGQEQKRVIGAMPKDELAKIFD